MSKDIYQLSVMGSNNVAKIVDALTDKQDDYTLVITTDSHQSFKEDKVRSYMVGIASKFNGERVVIYTEEEVDRDGN